MWFWGFLSLLGRLMLAAVFLMAACAHLIPRFTSVMEQLAAKQVPVPGLMLVCAIVLLIVGSGLVILGWQARVGACLLLIVLACSTHCFHDFWNTADGPQRHEQLFHFMKNLALAGALIFILANGSGEWSLDQRSMDDDSELI